MLLEELPSSDNRAKEDEIFQALLTFLSDPQAPQDLTLKWFVTRLLPCPVGHVLGLLTSPLFSLVQFSEWLEEGGKRDLAEKTFKYCMHALRATQHVAVLPRIIELTGGHCVHLGHSAHLTIKCEPQHAAPCSASSTCWLSSPPSFPP